MKNVLNPSYSAKMNDYPEEFTLVVHVPELPSATGVYKDSVYFLETDKCFYQCIEINGSWKWRKVTYGPTRQFVLPVSYIVAGEYGYTFDDELHALRQIIIEMERYDNYFVELHSNNQWIDPTYEPTEDETPGNKTYYTLNQNGGYTKCVGLIEFDNGVDYYEDTSAATLNQVITLANEVIGWVNYNCGYSLDLISDGITITVTQGGATCEELATGLNLLIGALNPHAGFSILAKEVETLKGKIAERGEPTFTAIDFISLRDNLFPKTSDTELVLGKAYYEYTATYIGGVYTQLLRRSTYDTEESAQYAVLENLREYDGTPIYINTDGNYVKLEGTSLSGIVSTVKYYTRDDDVRSVTVEDFNTLYDKVSNLKASYEQFVADKNFLDNNQNATISVLTQFKDSVNSEIESLKTKSDTIIKTYIGWNKYTSSSKISVIERLASIEEQMTPGSEGNFVSRLSYLENSISGESGVLRRLAAVEESLNTVSQSVANANAKATNANSSIATLSENNAHAHSVFTKAINNLNSSVRGMLTEISSINLSEDASLENVVAAVRSIISASQNILNGNSSQEGD